MSPKSFFLLLVLFLHHTHFFGQSINYTTMPSWVKVEQLPLSLQSVETKRKMELVYVENQTNFILDESYYRFVYKLSNISQHDSYVTCSDTFHPSDDSLKIVRIAIIRNNKRIDVTHSLKTQIRYQKELIRKQFYYATQKLTFFFDEIENGDLIVFEIIKENLRSDIKSLAIPEYKFIRGIPNVVRIISDKPLLHVEINDLPLPQSSKTQWGHELFWNVKPNKLPKKKRSDRFLTVPKWYYSQPLMSATPFHNIQELKEWKLPFYQVDSLGLQIVEEKQKTLTAKCNSKEEMIAEIINYIQDSIKYLEYGLYNPYSPSRVISDGYGDCKSKSLLGVKLLHSIGVNAWPISVNSNGYEYQFESLVSPQNYNHCVIQFVHQHDTITVDPTMSHQTDIIGEYELPAFQKGLRMIKNSPTEVWIPDQGTATLKVFDSYDFESTFKRKVIFEGHEASRMRKHIYFEGKKSLYNIFDEVSWKKYTYPYFLDLGVEYHDSWNIQGDIHVVDKNSITENQIEITLEYELEEDGKLEMPKFDLKHFNVALNLAQFENEITQPVMIEKVDVFHQLVLKSPYIKKKHSDDIEFQKIDTVTDFCTYKADASLSGGSLILSQALKTVATLKPQQYTDFLSFVKTIEEKREKLAKIPTQFNDYIPQNLADSPEKLRRDYILSILLLIITLFFSSIALIDLFKKIKKKIKLRKARNAAVIIFFIFFSNMNYAQDLTRHPLPDWVAVYHEEHQEQIGEGIIQIRKEVQINNISKETFYQDIYSVNTPFRSGNYRFHLAYNPIRQDIFIHKIEIQRKNKKIDLLKKHIRLVTVKEYKESTTLKESKLLHLWNDDFMVGDIITISYLTSYKESYKPSFTDYQFKADKEGSKCRYIFRIMYSKEDRLNYQVLRHFNQPKTKNDVQVLEWDQLFKVEKLTDEIQDYMPTWYSRYPSLFVYSTQSIQELTNNILVNLNETSSRFSNRELDSLISSIVTKECQSLEDTITQLCDFVKLKILLQQNTLDDIQWSPQKALQLGYASYFTKTKLMKAFLQHLNIAHEEFLVKEHGLDPEFKSVLSRHLFTHNILRYQISGQECYFDPIIKSLEPKVTLRERVNYKYGLNLTNTNQSNELQKLSPNEKNLLIFKDTVQTNGVIHRKLIAKGWVATYIRKVHYNPDTNLKDFINNVNNLDVSKKKLHLSLWDVHVDSLSFLESKGNQVEVDYYGQLEEKRVFDNYTYLKNVVPLKLIKELFYFVDLETVEMYDFPKLNFEHSITIHDTLLKKETFPVFHIATKNFLFERKLSFTDQLATIHHHFVSHIDYYNKSVDDEYFTDNLSDLGNYNYFTLKEFLKTPYNHSNRVPKRRAFEYFIYSLIIIPLYGVLVSVKWMKKRRKRALSAKSNR